MNLRAPFPWFGGKNRGKERIWFSPHCLPVANEGGLFAVAEAS